MNAKDERKGQRAFIPTHKAHHNTKITVTVCQPTSSLPNPKKKMGKLCICVFDDPLLNILRMNYHCRIVFCGAIQNANPQI